MAPITVDDVMEPKGEIVVEMFPGRTEEQVKATIAEWVASGHDLAARSTLTLSDADKNAAVFAYAHFRTWSRIVARMIRRPNQANWNDDGQVTWSPGSITHAKAERDRFLAEWLKYVPDPGQSPAKGGESTSTPHLISF